MTSVVAHIPSPPKHNFAGKDGAHQWSESAHRTLKLANAEVCASAHLRGESERTHKNLFRAVNEQQSVVNERLKKRIKECTVLRTKLRTEEKVLQAEVAQLQSAWEKTLKLQKKLSKPLLKAKERNEIRSHRPTEENITDIATRSITLHLDGVQEIQNSLLLNAQNAEGLVAKMRKHLGVLQHDIAQKTQAIEVDVACLQFGEASFEDPAASGRTGKAENTLSTTTLPGASEGPYAVAKSLTNVESWKQVSGYNVEVSRGLSNASKDLRNRLLVDVKRFTEVQQKLNSDCLDALAKRRNQTRQYISMMESQLRKLESEMSILTEEHAKVVQALGQKQRPLDIARKRLENRVNRPGREAVRDEVEVELEKEFARLVVAVEALQAKQRTIETELLRLEKARATVLADHDRKVSALTLEQQCLDIDAKSDYLMESRQSTPRSQSGGAPLGETSKNNGVSLPPLPQSARVPTPRSYIEPITQSYSARR